MFMLKINLLVKMEKEQLKKLVEKQQIKISNKAELKEVRIIAESELYSQKTQKLSDFNCCC